MDAALAQLREAAAEDDSLLTVRISADVLGNAVAAARDHGVNAARVNDIEFALHDLIEAVDDAGAPDAVCVVVAQLQNEAAALRRQTQLPREILDAARALQAKLRARAKAMERAQYRVEGAEAGVLPHSPEELRADAVPLARHLVAAGFATPALDALIATRNELRYHTLNEVDDELDAILGG